MRNLHLENLRYNTPLFLGILDSLGIHVSPEQDERALRRFLMGRLLTPVEDPVRQDVKRSVEIPANFSYSGHIDSFFDQAKNELLNSLSGSNTPPNYTEDINVGFFVRDGQTMFEVTFMSPETDRELATRKSFAQTFNQLLTQKDRIYKLIVEQLLSSKKTA